jgi:hypothetical protein
MVSKSELSSMNPLEKIVWRLIREADAHAVHAKVAWGIGKKKSESGCYTADAMQFEQNGFKLSGANDSIAGKVRVATQARFISFLEGEFLNPLYLQEYLEAAYSSGNDVRVWCRTLAESPLLGLAFFTRLSQVGNTAHYIDSEGARRTKQLFLDKLPAAVAQARLTTGAKHAFG